MWAVCSEWRWLWVGAAGGVGLVAERKRVNGRPRAATVPADPRGSTAERLQYLFQNVRLPGEPSFSAAEVARWINGAGGQISSVSVLKILRGERGVSLDKLQWIAKFFDVPVSPLVDEDPPEIDLDATITRLLQRRITGDPQQLLQKIALLSPETQAALGDIIDNLLRAEGKTVPS